MAADAAGPFPPLSRAGARFDAWRWGPPLALGLSLAFLVIAAALFLAAWNGAFGTVKGIDIEHYLDGTRRWLETGTPYLAGEVAAPFEYQPLSFLHPPIALLLFAPFLIVPLVLWWAIPLGIVAVSVVAWRPSLLAWPIIAALLASDRLHGVLIVGNSDIWVWAFIALGLRAGAAAWAIVIKPSLGPLVLLGAWDGRRWLVGAVVAVVLAIPFGSLWWDWWQVVQNSPGNVTYSLGNLPWLAVPVVARLFATRR